MFSFLSDDLFIYYIFYPWCTLIGTYTLISAIYYYLDLYIVTTPTLAKQYKTQGIVVHAKDYKKSYSVVIYNFITCSFLSFCITYYLYYTYGVYQPSTSTSFLFSNHFTYSILTFLVTIVLHETWFTFTHYLCHSYGILYKTIHAKHHEFSAPIGISALYVTWYESFFIVFISGSLGIWCMRPHYGFLCFWNFIAMLTLISSHSGYGKYTMVSSEKHDLHHQFLRYNYSTWGFYDWLLGTSLEKAPTKMKR